MTEFPLEFDSDMDLNWALSGAPGGAEPKHGHLTGVERSRHQPEQVLRQLEDLPLAPFPAAHRCSGRWQVEIRTPLRGGRLVWRTPDPASSCGGVAPGASDDHEGGEPLRFQLLRGRTGRCAPASQVINIF